VPGEPLAAFYAFGPFRLDISQRVLVREGKTVPLTPKAVETLLVLVQSNGRVLEKDELMQKIWPDTFVEEVNLAHHISVLRKVLGESENGERYIQTVPRRGYRFVAPVDVEAREDQSHREQSSDSVGVTPVRLEGKPDRRLVWGIVSLGVLLTAGAASWFARSKPDFSMPLTAVPLTSYVGSEFQPNFSPDGNQVAFTWNGETQDNFDVYVKLIGTSQPLRLTQDPGADWSPAWSPDGRSIAFLRIWTEGFALVTVPSLGGPEQTLLEVHDRKGGYVRGPYLAWSQDGKSLVFSYSESPNEPVGLFLLSLETREKTRLTSPPAGSLGDSAPAFSPNGRTLVFDRTAGTVISDLYLLVLSESLKPLGEPRRLTFGTGDAHSPVWNSDGSEIVYATCLSGLWRIGVSSSAQPQRLTGVGENGDFPTVSRHQARLAYSRGLVDLNIWRVEVRLHGQAGRPTKFIASTLTDGEPQFSPDGRRIVFSSNQSGSDEIWVCNSDGSNRVPLTSFNGPQLGSPRWSPDSKRIAFDARVDRQFDIHVLDVHGGKPQRLTTHSADDFLPCWSHDGKWIYFGSNRSGERQVWKMPSQGGEAEQVTRRGGFLALESAEGGFLYYVKGEDKDQEFASGSLWKMPTQGGDETQVLESVTWRAFTLVKDGIYFVPRQNTGSVRTIQFLSFATGKLETVTNIEMPVWGALSVSPDGKWILYSQFDQLGSDLMLVENFR
jgi:Tol biopolymer transport system component/DNA-binding winged helix-turn-helix (wHTH) protein